MENLARITRRKFEASHWLKPAPLSGKVELGKNWEWRHDGIRANWYKSLLQCKTALYTVRATCAACTFESRVERFFLQQETNIGFGYSSVAWPASWCFILRCLRSRVLGPALWPPSASSFSFHRVPLPPLSPVWMCQLYLTTLYLQSRVEDARRIIVIREWPTASVIAPRTSATAARAMFSSKKATATPAKHVSFCLNGGGI